jgi:hypothetical protein
MIVIRNWKPLQINGKFYVAFEKWNEEDPNDSKNNGIYVYVAPNDEISFDDLENHPDCQRVQTTQYPTVMIDIDVKDNTAGVAWVEDTPEGLLINLAETFYGGTNNFVVCSNPTLLPDARAMESLDLTITKNKNDGKYEYLLLYVWIHKQTGDRYGGKRRHC